MKTNKNKLFFFSSDSDASVEYNSNSGKAQSIRISDPTLSEKILNNVTGTINY